MNLPNTKKMKSKCCVLAGCVRSQERHLINIVEFIIGCVEVD